MKDLTFEEIQQELLALLEVFDRFTREHGLRYSLDSGTLLGAVRHKGFIPWDDDLDLIMPRPDFERFVELSAELPEGYALRYVETDGTTFPYGKLINTRIEVHEGRWNDRRRYLWIDIFPVDGMSLDESENQRDYEASLKLQDYRRFQTYPARTWTQNLIKRPIRFVMNRYRPAEETVRAITALATKRPFEGSLWCRDLVCANNPAARLRTADFDDLVMLDFEGGSFPAVPHWDEYLTSQYGDYMQLPPEDQRVSHRLRAWYVDD